MLPTFFKSAVRFLWKNKTYSLLNLFGLAIGITCAGLIFLWVENERSYDATYAKKDRLYRILENQTYESKTRTFWSTPALMGPAIRTEIPGIANTCRASFKEALFRFNDKTIFEKGMYADSSFFSMFGLQFLQGNAGDAFNRPENLVISERMAARFFEKDKNIIGSTLTLDNDKEYVITGVVKDLPASSTVQADWVIPFDVYFKRNETRFRNWGVNSVVTYVELAAAADPSVVNKQLYDFIEKKEPGAEARAFLFSMNDWRLRDHFEDGQPAGGRIEYVRMFSVIAWIILLIACINYMNLATARSEKRVKEVSMHKILGAGKGSMVFRLIGEAILLSVLAVAIGVLLILLVLPFFNSMTGTALTPGLDNPTHLAILAMIALVCGLIAGSYPALYLASFNPIRVLKGFKLKNTGAALVRKGLVVVQFAVSIIFIIATIIISRQLQHVQNRQIGYDRNNLLSLPVRGSMARNFDVIRQELLNTGLIENAALNSFNTFHIGNNSSSYTWQGKDPANDVLISYRDISPGLIATLGMRITEGRDFRPGTGDSLSVIVTESLARMMGGKNVIGSTLYDGDSTQYQVAGVVNDMVYGDMYGKGDPIIFFCRPLSARYIYARIKPGVAPSDAVARLEAIMPQYNQGYPFDYQFADDQFNELFKSEMMTGKLARLFAALAILISCLGLFGLAAYMAEQRKKEIGIRKVLGAGVHTITGLLSKDFLKLVGIAAVVAFPVAWWSMHSWLQQFNYRTTISVWVFVLAGAIAVIIALLTISFQTIRAATANPVKSLRTE